MKPYWSNALKPALLVAACVFASPLFAQSSFPQKPVRLVTALPAGGDAYVRVLATRLSDQLGQSVVVENRTGADGSVSIEALVRAKADFVALGDFVWNNEEGPQAGVRKAMVAIEHAHARTG